MKDKIDNSERLVVIAENRKLVKEQFGSLVVVADRLREAERELEKAQQQGCAGDTGECDEYASDAWLSWDRALAAAQALVSDLEERGPAQFNRAYPDGCDWERDDYGPWEDED